MNKWLKAFNKHNTQLFTTVATPKYTQGIKYINSSNYDLIKVTSQLYRQVQTSFSVYGQMYTHKVL